MLGLIFGGEALRRYQVLANEAEGPSPTFLYGDCPYLRATTRSLLQRGSLDLRPEFLSPQRPAWFTPVTNASLGTQGEWYPKHTLVLPALAVPFLALLGDPGLLVLNVLLLVALCVVLFRLCVRAAGVPAALVVTVWFASGTLLRPLAYNFSPDVLSTLLVLLDVELWLAGWPMLSGAAMGMAVVTKWSNGVLVFPLALWVWRARAPAGRWRWCAGLGLWAVVGATLNTVMFGAPWVTPYDRVMAAVTLEGVTLEASHRSFFDQPFFMGLWTQLTDPRMGVVASAPPVLVSVVGWMRWRRRPEFPWGWLAGTAAVQLAFFAPYRLWQESNAGHRFVLTALVLMAPAAALAVASLWDTPGASAPDGHGAANPPPPKPADINGKTA